MREKRFCVDCEHHRRSNIGADFCKHPQTLNLVTKAAIDCAYARSREMPCGIDGALYVPKLAGP